MELSGKNYIGNQLKGEGQRTFKTFNPRLNSENNWEFVEATKSEIEEACKLAKNAFKIYRKISCEERAKFLETVVSEIRIIESDVLDVFVLESGLTIERGRIELNRTIDQILNLSAFLKSEKSEVLYSDEAQPERLPTPRPSLVKTVQPLGPIVVFGASNFPFAYSTLGGDTASALAAGCPVIVKSHPMHAGTGELMSSAIVKAIQKSKLPEGVFSNLNGSGIDLGEQIVLNDSIKGVGFTGSIKGGRAIYNLAATRKEPIPVFAEMGSVNPVVLLEEGILNQQKHWAKTIADSMTNGAGQFCTNPGLFLAIDSEATSSFISALIDELKTKKGECMLHPSIKSSYRHLKTKYLNNSSVASLFEKEGEEVMSDISLLKIGANEILKTPNLIEEVFGPFSILVLCDNIEQLCEVITNLEGQLTGTIIANQEKDLGIQKIIEVLEERVGRVIFNGVPTGVEICPSMHHGGPYPASTDSRFTAVGVHAIQRWQRYITYQNVPKEFIN